MFLTRDQQQALINASSGLSPKEFFKLTKAETEAYATRLENTVKQIQKANPNAFVWKYTKEGDGAVKVDIQTECEKRKFFDAPTGVGKYKSAVKSRIRFPEAFRVAQGVK